MKNALPLLVGPLGVALVSALVWTTVPRESSLTSGDLIVIPFAVSAVRVPGVSTAQLLVYEPRERPQPTRITAVRLRVDGLLLHEQLDPSELVGAAEFGEVNALIERLPETITEMSDRRRWFADASAPEFSGAEAFLRWGEVAERVAGLRSAYASGVPQPFAAIDLPLPLDQIFSGEEAPGTQRTVSFEVDYIGPDGLPAVASVEHVVRWLGPARQPSATLASGTAVAYAGDLHVHSCHGEAVNACSPLGGCAAENLQITGSFSYAALKSQFQVMGLTWFTATDHSYCVDTDAEFTAIVNEIAAINDPGFFAFPDIELTSEEQGPQVSGDAANAQCGFLTAPNHMGAHGITERKQGGGRQFLGYCNNLEQFTDNATSVRAEGGWPVVHHPLSNSNSWNSNAFTEGIESQQMHGVEVWNGTNLGGALKVWTDWLLGGRILYAYWGSDIHGAAHTAVAAYAVLVNEPYTPDNLLSALFGGRVYLSEQHSLQIEVEIESESYFMGTLHALSVGQGLQDATVRVHYDFGSNTGVITVFEGRVGDNAETQICKSGPLTGSGDFTCPVVVAGAVNSWYRAQSTANEFNAVTNPVFFLAGTGDVGSYCTAKLNSQGCTPAIDWNGLPSASLESPFTVSASNVLNNKSGLLFYGLASAAVPFQGGIKCVAAPTRRTPLLTTGGNPPPDDCSGTYSFDFQERIQSGIDPKLVPGATVYCQFWGRDLVSPSGTGLTDALRFTIQP